MDDTISDEELNAAFDGSFVTDGNQLPFHWTSHGCNFELNSEFRSSESSPMGSLMDSPSAKRLEVENTRFKMPIAKRRKLPGPAGLLPKHVTHGHVTRKKVRSTCTVLKELDVNHTTDNSVSLTPPGGCESEESELLVRAKDDCGLNIWSSVEKYSISNALQMVSKGHLPRGKVPVMCCFVDDVELLPTDAKAVLKDSTGSIGCTIHRSVVKEYKDQLFGCALLLLKQVSLFSPTGKKFYINVTLSNIVRIYTIDQTFPQVTARSVNDMPASTTPFSSDELRQLEAECLRPLSPAKLSVKDSNRISHCIRKGDSTFNNPVSFRTRHPASVSIIPASRNTRNTPNIRTSTYTSPRSSVPGFQKAHATPAVSANDLSSAYHINPPTAVGTATFDQLSVSIPSPRLGPGLGSLVRSCTPMSSKPISSTQNSPSGPNSTSFNLTKEVSDLLNDDMDDLLRSVVDEPVEVPEM